MKLASSRPRRPAPDAGTSRLFLASGFLIAAVALVAQGCAPKGAAVPHDIDASPAMDPRQDSAPSADQGKPKMAKATFGGGCFWCIEAVFERIPGVSAAVSGYAGGHVDHPTYEAVCTGRTGHAEVVQVEYDPLAVSYEKLLEVFFAAHDPTTLDRQGPDEGTQYRSVIFAHDDTQARLAKKAIDALNEADAFGAPVVTRVEGPSAFHAAEAYHQDYYRNNPGKGYCRVMIAPKLKKLGLD